MWQNGCCAPTADENTEQHNEDLESGNESSEYSSDDENGEGSFNEIQNTYPDFNDSESEYSETEDIILM